MACSLKIAADSDTQIAKVIVLTQAVSTGNPRGSLSKRATSKTASSGRIVPREETTTTNLREGLTQPPGHARPEQKGRQMHAYDPEPSRSGFRLEEAHQVGQTLEEGTPRCDGNAWKLAESSEFFGWCPGALPKP